MDSEAVGRRSSKCLSWPGWDCLMCKELLHLGLQSLVMVLYGLCLARVLVVLHLGVVPEGLRRTADRKSVV